MPPSSAKPTEVSNFQSKAASRVLRLNVGFLLKEGIGYSREMGFDEPMVQVSDDLTVQNLTGSVTLTRTPQGLYVQGRLTGLIDNECARCLDTFDQPISARLGE